MIVMVSNQTNPTFHEIAKRYTGQVGHLYSVPGWRDPLRHPWFPHALDNGAWSAFKNGKEWPEDKYRAMLDKAAACPIAPLWAVVPDVVTDRDATLLKWDVWAPIVSGYGFRLAVAVQDGMVPDDVPDDADVVFVGGSTEWKWGTLDTWRDLCKSTNRIFHVARVNTGRRLWRCHHAGVDSIDGTGWWHDGQKAQLVEYLRSVNGESSQQNEMFNNTHPNGGRS
jgi:hypothetical protein